MLVASFFVSFHCTIQLVWGIGTLIQVVTVKAARPVGAMHTSMYSHVVTRDDIMKDGKNA